MNKIVIIIFLFIFAFIKPAHAIEIAVTVDDLPYNGDLPPNTTRMEIASKMLRVFQRHHIQQIYGFINAKKLEENKQYEKILTSWIANGNLLGNHTFSHTDLAKVNADTYIADIQKNEPYLKKFMHDKNYKYFRYPYLAEGNTLEKRNAIRNYLFEHQYQIAPVTTDFFDYEWNAAYVRCLKKQDNNSIKWLKQSYLEQALNALTISHQLSRFLFHRDIKNIFLIHINAFNAEMLDQLLTEYKRQGVKFISLKNALSDKVYSINPNVAIDRPYTFLNQVRLARNLKNPAAVKKLYENLPEDSLKLLCT